MTLTRDFPLRWRFEAPTFPEQELDEVSREEAVRVLSRTTISPAAGSTPRYLTETRFFTVTFVRGRTWRLSKKRPH
jgi:hypothetical protein